MKVANDKYYTPIKIANHCWDVVDNVIGLKNIDYIIEPSVGSGAFCQYPKRKPDLGIDILPEIESTNETKIVKYDFLKYFLTYRPKTLFIGNVPFGNNSATLIKFYKKCCRCGDYISFIVPIGYINNQKPALYEFDLIYSEDLGMQHYTDRDLHCCLNIYKRPANGKLNNEPNFELNEIDLVEFRRSLDEETNKKKLAKLDKNYDYSFCSFGNGCIGKRPEYEGQYSKEVYVYIKNKDIKDDVIKLLSYENLKKLGHGIGAASLSKQQIYKFILDSLGVKVSKKGENI